MSNLEETSNSDWRIFAAADQKLTTWRKRYVRSYDQFVQDKKLENSIRNPKPLHVQRHDYEFATKTGVDSGDEQWSDINENIPQDDVGFNAKPSKESKESPPETMSSEDGNPMENEKFNQLSDSDSWESMSEKSDKSTDSPYDTLVKSMRQDLNEVDETPDDSHSQTHYASLSEHLMRFRREREPPSDEVIFNANENLSMEQKLPIVRALDALNDINKVLRVGKLTTKMERIMEYKMDHPFAEGYDDDELGCCQWIVYKIEVGYARFIKGQWPYY